MALSLFSTSRANSIENRRRNYMCLNLCNAHLTSHVLVPVDLLHRGFPVRLEYVTGLGARLVTLRPIILRCFHRELVDVCPELRHLYFAHLGSKLSLRRDSYTLISSSFAISLARSLLDLLLPSSLAVQSATQPTMQTVQAANATSGEASFLGLPREVRDMIYKELFGMREERGFQGRFRNILTDRVMVMDSLQCVKGTYPAQKTPNPNILWASHQLRTEAGAIYYSKQELYLDHEYSEVLDEIRLWADVVVHDLATYLRDVRVHFAALGTAMGEDVQHQHTIHLKFSDDRGLTVEGYKGGHDYNSEDDDYIYVADMKYLVAHAAAIEDARVAHPGRKGEAILDFFLLDHDALRNACFGPAIKWHSYIGLESGEVEGRVVDCDPEDPKILVTRKRHW